MLGITKLGTGLISALAAGLTSMLAAGDATGLASTLAAGDAAGDTSGDTSGLGIGDISTEGAAEGVLGGGGGMLGITKLGTALVSMLTAGLTFTLAAADTCGLALADGSPTTASTSHTNGSSMLADPVRSSKSPKYT